MKPIVYILSLGIVFSATAFMSFVNTWSITDNYQVRFSGSGAEGTFSELAGTIQFDPQNLAAANMNVSVAVATIDTGNSTKDKHARGDSWFDAKKYPKITFRSQTFREIGTNYEVVGELTLHGVTKTVTIPFSFQGQVFAGAFTVNREDYGITGPWLAFTVGEAFNIELKVPVV